MAVKYSAVELHVQIWKDIQGALLNEKCEAKIQSNVFIVTSVMQRVKLHVYLFICLSMSLCVGGCIRKKSEGIQQTIVIHSEDSRMGKCGTWDSQIRGKNRDFYILYFTFNFVWFWRFYDKHVLYVTFWFKV